MMQSVSSSRHLRTQSTKRRRKGLDGRLCAYQRSCSNQENSLLPALMLRLIDHFPTLRAVCQRRRNTLLCPPRSTLHWPPTCFFKATSKHASQRAFAAAPRHLTISPHRQHPMHHPSPAFLDRIPPLGLAWPVRFSSVFGMLCVPLIQQPPISPAQLSSTLVFMLTSQ